MHPLQGGFFRRKVRTQRRSGLPRENPLDLLSAAASGRSPRRTRKLIAYYWFLHRIRKKVERDTLPYIDPALQAVAPEAEITVPSKRKVAA